VEIYEEIDVLGQFRDDILPILSDDKRAKLRPLPAPGTLDVALVRQSRYCFA
jgi:DNA-directed RNA polymerase